MDWIEIGVEADGEAAEAVSELFNRVNGRPDGQGGAVTEVSGFDPVGEDHRVAVTVKTYLPADEPDTAARQRAIEEGLWYLGRIHPIGQPILRRLADEDWANAWKAGYHPLRIGRRFLVIPAWLQAEAPPAPDDLSPPGGDLRLVLDPGMAFGTGLHPSTQLCLRVMEELPPAGQRVLDAGCGSGILSIAARRLGAASVDAFDIDPLAVRATRENAALNGLPDAIHVEASAGPDGGVFWRTPDGSPRAWDLILVNILPHVILALLDGGLAAHLAPGGRMVLAGIIEAREPDVRAGLARHGLAVEGRLGEGDWVALVVGATGLDHERRETDAKEAKHDRCEASVRGKAEGRDS
jgi:ribosomal protein L11 methyltransferase